MNKVILIFILCCLVLMCTFTKGAPTHKENDSNETSASGEPLKIAKCQENEGKDCDIDYSNSNETGPLDSHEAMNTRSKRSADIDKRVFRNMLLGLYKKSEQQKKRDEYTIQDTQFQSDASELLLELMVRIAAHPQQWNEVHELLRKIDNDIVTSRKLIADLEENEYLSTSPPSVQTTTQQSTTVTESQENTTVGEVQRLIILLDNEEQKSRSRNKPKNSVTWPNLDEQKTNDVTSTKQHVTNEKLTTENMYPWNNKKPSLIKEKEFTFHRVTGKPLHYRSNYDKTTARNAYVAVSVIGPKNKDNLLEDELRQLKPWNHQDNLNKMENLRKKWFIQPDRQK